MLGFVLDVLFPKKCIGCSKEGSYFCLSCEARIFHPNLICPKCKNISPNGQTHDKCQEKVTLDGLWSLGIYKNPLKNAILQLKYKYTKEITQNLVDVLIKYWENSKPFIYQQIIKDKGIGWIIVPVPLYWYRANSRGFNQSSLIGQSLSRKLSLEYCEGLRRIRSTKSQVSIKGKDRYQNMKNAFSRNTKYSVQEKNILLIDDVWTTGSTMKECCIVLKKAGAKKVWAITLAR